MRAMATERHLGMERQTEQLRGEVAQQKILYSDAAGSKTSNIFMIIVVFQCLTYLKDMHTGLTATQPHLDMGRKDNLKGQVSMGSSALIALQTFPKNVCCC